MDLNKINELQIILFTIGKVTYAIPISYVDYIEKYMVPTRIPNSPPFVEGVINLRGSVIPILDLRKRFGVEQVEYTNKTRIIIVALNNRKFGFIVDTVSEVITLNRSQIEPSLPTVSGIKSDFILCIGKVNEKLIIILNIERLIFTEKEEEIIEKR
jgi:purine-binding chemotaxis protein CheW